ncbi:MAG TPA: GGDEF domain-containing protein [Gemmatimonadaceae bacterium]
MPFPRRSFSLPRAVRAALALLLPEGAVLLAAALAVRSASARAAIEPVLPYFLPTMLAIGAVISWRFNRARLLLAIVVLALAERALRLFPSAAPGVEDAGPVAMHLAAILVAANLTALAFLRERSLRSADGLRRIAAVLLQIAGVAAVYAAWPPDLGDPLARELVPLAAWEGVGVPQLVALSFVAALATQAVRALWRPETVARGFFWATAAALLAFGWSGDALASTLALVTGGVVLVVAAMEHAHAMAYRDELTGLPARRALNEAMQRLDGGYTVAMVDVDHFKQFNDRHGHDVGDQVLRLVASRLARVNHGGRAFRYGGEEFTVLLPGVPLDESVKILDALRRDVAEAVFTLRGADRPKRKPTKPRPRRAGAQQLSVTVSIGAAERRGRQELPDAVVKAADRALYRAKEAGRNRVAK